MKILFLSKRGDQIGGGANTPMFTSASEKKGGGGAARSEID